MNTQSNSNAGSGCSSHDLFAEVRPGGMLGRCLDAISNPRKHRWNAYLRACKRIPITSPIYGSTSFDKINGRRHELIAMMFKREDGKTDILPEYDAIKSSEEYQAVTNATSEWLCGGLVASNFLMGRLLRRLKAKVSSANAKSDGTAGDGTTDHG